MSCCRQTHSVNLIYKGSFLELIEFLKIKGIETQVALPGLIGSNATLEIVEKEKCNEE